MYMRELGYRGVYRQEETPLSPEEQRRKYEREKKQRQRAQARIRETEANT
jgi:hypothetical protein